MSIIALRNHTWYRMAKKAQKQASLWERFCRYYRKNEAEIICGYLMMNGNVYQACELYQTLRDPKNRNL